ncbi:hypothetical protein ACN42_g2234 [Penicillium freii]|uniref:Uncharacterized protein n=1 Tax=Penicillium freii TaxID=48697 RepID=A0A117NR36_PENFR|nr:hypothetical protein ACN42_g2234 [Penicillium freii]
MGKPVAIHIYIRGTQTGTKPRDLYFKGISLISYRATRFIHRDGNVIIVFLSQTCRFQYQHQFTAFLRHPSAKQLCLCFVASASPPICLVLPIWHPPRRIISPTLLSHAPFLLCIPFPLAPLASYALGRLPSLLLNLEFLLHGPPILHHT